MKNHTSRIPDLYQCFKLMMACMVSGARQALSDVTTSDALEKILLAGALVAIIKKLLTE